MHAAKVEIHDAHRPRPLPPLCPFPLLGARRRFARHARPRLRVIRGGAGRPPDLVEPARTGQRADTDAAVVVGVEDYAYLPDVAYARGDAQVLDDFV